MLMILVIFQFSKLKMIEKENYIEYCEKNERFFLQE